jgi:hypothetical protein
VTAVNKKGGLPMRMYPRHNSTLNRSITRAVGYSVNNYYRHKNHSNNNSSNNTTTESSTVVALVSIFVIIIVLIGACSNL